MRIGATRGTRQLILVLTATMTAVLLASGLAVAATLTGTDGGDQIRGTDGVDEIQGKGGNDTLEGLAGNDRVVGGADNDDLYGGDAAGTALAGEDVVIGEHGNDKLYGGPAADELRGSAGNDTVFSGEVPFVRDVVDCGDGTDEAWADPLDSVANNCEKVYIGHQGTGGNDTIDGSDDGDKIWGHEGNDTVSGKGGADAIRGGHGDDLLYGSDDSSQTSEGVSADGDNEIYGERGSDLVVGGPGRDQLQGGAGRDIIVQGPPSDTSEDRISGGDGNDLVDTANLSASKDIVDCGGGTDEVTADSLDEVSSNCENVEIFEHETPPEGEPNLTAEQEAEFRTGAKEVGGLTDQEVEQALEDAQLLQGVPVRAEEYEDSEDSTSLDQPASESDITTQAVRCGTLTTGKKYVNIFGTVLFRFEVPKYWCWDYYRVTYAPSPAGRPYLTVAGNVLGWRWDTVTSRSDYYLYANGNYRGGHRSFRAGRFLRCVGTYCYNQATLNITQRVYYNGTRVGF